MMHFIKKIMLMRWLWEIFAGFYLIAYSFWVSTIFNNLAYIALVYAITLILGFGLADLPLKKLWQILSGIFLLGYLSVYNIPKGHIVPHWPLDMVITVVAGVLMFVYVVLDQTKEIATV